MVNGGKPAGRERMTIAVTAIAVNLTCAMRPAAVAAGLPALLTGAADRRRADGRPPSPGPVIRPRPDGRPPGSPPEPVIRLGLDLDVYA